MSDSSESVESQKSELEDNCGVESLPRAQRTRTAFSSNCLPKRKVEPDRRMRETPGESRNSYMEELPATSGFSAMFHVSIDNKLAHKFFGTEHHILEEQKRQHDYYHWIVHPYSSFRWHWDFFMVILLFVTVIFLPVNIAFYQDDYQVSWSVLNCFTDLVFLIDIILNFRTGIVAADSYDQVILEPKQIARRYLRGWFCIDILSSIPFDYFTLIISSQNKSLQGSLIKATRALRVLRMAKLLSLLRLLRVSRLFRYVQRWEELFDVAGGVIRITNLIGTMLLLSHWNGCIQFLVPYLQGIPEDSWIAINRIENEPPSIQYSWALFKALSHMLCIGFGRFPPQTVTEVWLTILSMVTGATFYALFIGHMSSLLMSSDSSGRLYNEKWSQMEEYLRYRKISKGTRQRVLDYYQHRYQRKFFDEASLLSELSPPLRADIISHNCRSLVQSVPFFHEADYEFLNHVLSRLTFQVYLPGDVIIEEGTFGDSMYFIQHGIVEVSTVDGSIDTQLTEGSHFGEVCLLTDERRVATIRAVSICDLFALHRNDFNAVIDEYPEVRHMMETVAIQRLSKFGGEHCRSMPPDLPILTEPSFLKPDELSQNLEAAAAAVAASIDSRRRASRAASAAQIQRRISSSLVAARYDAGLPVLEEEVDETDV